MRELDVGALPVCDEDRLAGMVTDRDLALRGVADGKDPNTATVRDVMTPGVFYVFADQEVEEVARVMEDRQIRRVPVLNRGKRLVGIVSLGDIAISSNPAFSGMALRDVSEPTNPTARQRRLAQRSEPKPRVDVATSLRRSVLGRDSADATRGGSIAKPKAKRSSATPARKRKSATQGAKRKASPARARSKRSAAESAQ
jgi:CBS-domain-containing membrane protein